MIMDLIQRSATLPLWERLGRRVKPWRQRVDELHEKAIRAAGGFDDFGDTDYREPFEILMGSYDDESRLHPLGRWLAEYQVVGLLTNRLLSNKWWKEHPELHDVPIERPLVITGIVRTGSTALHYLMGANPDTQCLEFFLATHVQPRPPRHTWRRRRDFWAARAELAMMYGLGEGLEAIHHITADGPEECRHLLAQSFTDDCFEVGNHVPTYAAWYGSRNHVGSYRRHRRLIQIIGGHELGKRWLLKYPVHIRHIDALLEVYPDACIIQTHRDPAAILDSYVSLCTHFRKLQEREAPRREVALHQMEVWAVAAERALAARRRHPDRFHDVHFRDFMADPVGTAEKALAHWGQPLSAAGRAALEAHQRAHPPGKFGKHAYHGVDYGITREQIHERFATYMDALGIEREKGRGVGS